MAEKSKEFGERLKSLRLKKGLTQKQLAENAAVKGNISLYEEGRIPEAPILYKLAKELNISMEDLLFGKEEKEVNPPQNNLRRIDDYLARKDERYLPAKNNLDLIFKSNYEDVITAIIGNLEVFSGTVSDRKKPMKKELNQGKR